MIEETRPDAIHIVTEGPIGYRRAALVPEARLALHHRLSTPAFPNISASASSRRCASPMRLLRRFHAPAHGVMVATPSVGRELAARGFGNLAPWTRGVDRELFHPDRDAEAARTSAAGLPVCRARRRREESRRRFSRSICRAPRSWSARARSSPSSKAAIPGAHFLGRRENGALARALCLGRRVRLSEPHRHVRAGACSKRSPRACRSRPIRCRARST